jgi:hypothetical protein
MFINVNYDCQQFHQYQQSEQLHIASIYWTQKGQDIGQQGIGLGNTQNCGEV